MGRIKCIGKHSTKRTATTNWPVSLAIYVVLSCMALPGVVKFNHAVREHQEQHCNGDARTHIHASEFDCVFHKFKVATSFYPPLFVFDVYIQPSYRSYVLPVYSCFKSGQPLPYGLRAPPHFS